MTPVQLQALFALFQTVLGLFFHGSAPTPGSDPVPAQARGPCDPETHALAQSIVAHLKAK